jgi:hypothetical protein
VTEEFVEKKVSALRLHLGMTYHRYLENRRCAIRVDVFDSDTGDSGLPFDVEPIDPFAYGRSGSSGYPKTLIAQSGRLNLPLVCHIWPARSDSHYFTLTGGVVDRFQGFYLYRNDRLLSAGQWNGVAQESKRRRLARVSVDIEDHLDAFTMSVEKSGVRMSADLVRAVEHAIAADGTTFGDYLSTAEEVFQAGNKRARLRRPLLPPRTRHRAPNQASDRA